ncbi:MAG: dipeptide epimerase [Deltaproteobacteria bacterium]|nr:dipeptide epimerase [Deltaproteobacteria bacterium]
MRIERVEWVRVEMGLREPYTIAYETVDHAENLFVQVVTDGPYLGFGCAAPDSWVTGETYDAAAATLGAVSGALVGADPLRRARVLHALAPMLQESPSVAAAIDMALLDLLGKVAVLPVWRLLGGFRRSMPTSGTVFIGQPDRMVTAARRFVEEGFSAIKLKGGRDPEGDAEMVRRVRAAVGKKVALRFDANQGYTAEQAFAFLAAVEDLGLELFEQPTHRGEGVALHRVTQRASMAVMADESLLDLADAFRLARGELVDMINIKLMKVGGIEAALAVNAVARAAGLEAMVGCVDESALSIAAGLHLALARPNVEYADLDGHLDLLDDPGAGAVRLESGVLYPTDAPGLGLARLGCFG